MRDEELTFSEHLKDLRISLKYSFISLFIGFLVSWNWSEDIFNILRRPIDKYFPQKNIDSLSFVDLHSLLEKIAPHLTQEEIVELATSLNTSLGNILLKSPLYYQAPFEPFLVYLKLAFLTGFFLSFPFIFYFMWRFFAPALKEKEALLIIPIVIFASLLFVGGALVGYFFVFPFIIEFALSFQTSGLTPILTMNSYFSIFSKMLLGFGVIFELPLILILLAFLRIVSALGLIRFFKFALVGIFILSALLTPPDIISQFLMAMPLILLYMFSVLLVMILERFRKN